jgi:hypothetical protein
MDGLTYALAQKEFVHFFLFLAGPTREDLKPKEKNTSTSAGPA